MARKSTVQELREAERLAKKFPLFADQLAPRLPELKAHVQVHGKVDEIPEPQLYKEGDLVRVHKASYTLEYATGMVYKVKPSWSYDGRWNRWCYWVCYGPGQNVPLFHQKLPEWPNSRITAFKP